MLALVTAFSTQAYCALKNGLDNITLPANNDQYSQLARAAHFQEPSINFRNLRIAYLKSTSSKLSSKQLTELRKLRKEMFNAVGQKNASVIRAKAEAILNIKYIDLDAHKLLRQSCSVLADKACENRHRFVGLGLLKSIVANGDGRSCKTAWEVIAVEEEYFVLRMIGEKPKEQSVVQDKGRICDKMEVINLKKEPGVRYFEVSHVFTNYKAQLQQNHPK